MTKHLCILLLICCLLLPSCVASAKIQVDIDSDKWSDVRLKETVFTGFNPIWAYEQYPRVSTQVCIRNQRLHVLNPRENFVFYDLVQFEHGYFYGCDLGSRPGGWIKFSAYGYLPDRKDYIVLNERCRGIIRKTGDSGWLLTEFLGEGGIVHHLYSFEYSDDTKAYELELLDGIEQPRAAYYDETSGLLYVAAKGSIVTISESETTVLIESEILKELEVTSVAFLDGSVWCGMVVGLYQFDTQTLKETWYTLDSPGIREGIEKLERRISRQSAKSAD